jgi:hypothetical protein
MYGMVAQVWVKPRMDATPARRMRDIEARVPGVIAIQVNRMDGDTAKEDSAGVRDRRESYLANARNPEQHASYQEYGRPLEDGHDGAIIYAVSGRKSSFSGDLA